MQEKLMAVVSCLSVAQSFCLSVPSQQTVQDRATPDMRKISDEDKPPKTFLIPTYDWHSYRVIGGTNSCYRLILYNKGVAIEDSSMCQAKTSGKDADWSRYFCNFFVEATIRQSKVLPYLRLVIWCQATNVAPSNLSWGQSASKQVNYNHEEMKASTPWWSRIETCAAPLDHP